MNNRVHEDPVLFREAVNFTAAETRFLPRLIEKDYFCTILLEYLAAYVDRLVFKGGTCLAKVHAGFYRPSEDLDFVIPVSVSSSRSERRDLTESLKNAVAELPSRQDTFRIVESLKGANNSTQYVAVVGYTSGIGPHEETVKIEVGLREPLLTGPIQGNARTLLLHPVSGKPMVPVVSLPCISLNEAMAEKLRAALSRREAAIRDFFDIDFAERMLDLRPLDDMMKGLVRRKLAVPGNGPVVVSRDRLTELRRQLDTRLKPVLRTRDFSEFDLDRAFETVVSVARGIEAKQR
jgi:predicted nucleotidyltransferase component of viral defense system